MLWIWIKGKNHRLWTAFLETPNVRRQSKSHSEKEVTFLLTRISSSGIHFRFCKEGLKTILQNEHKIWLKQECKTRIFTLPVESGQFPFLNRGFFPLSFHLIVYFWAAIFKKKLFTAPGFLLYLRTFLYLPANACVRRHISRSNWLKTLNFQTLQKSENRAPEMWSAARVVMWIKSNVLWKQQWAIGRRSV